MVIETFFKCQDNDYPTVNVVGECSFSDEIQIHQGASFYAEPATLAGDMHRDVISMSREQAIAVAKQILEFTGA